MSKDSFLSKTDMAEIESNEEYIFDKLYSIEKAKQFKVGDVLICTCSYYSEKQPMKNSYGTHTKYKVVYVDKSGISYVKEISSKGEPRGRIKALASLSRFGIEVMEAPYFEFEHDPHFVESIILSSENNYDPTDEQRKRKTARDSITKHNLESKVNNNLTNLIATFNTMLPGQTWWFSVKNNMTINKITVTKPKNTGQYKRGTLVNEIEVTLSNGKQATYQPHDFLNKNLYDKQPRSYKELSDSI